MSSLPSLKPYKVLRILKKAGFYVHHQTGSHLILRHKIGYQISLETGIKFLTGDKEFKGMKNLEFVK